MAFLWDMLENKAQLFVPGHKLTQGGWLGFEPRTDSKYMFIPLCYSHDTSHLQALCYLVIFSGTVLCLFPRISLRGKKVRF